MQVIYLNDGNQKAKFKRGDIAISKATGSIVFIVRVYELEDSVQNEGILFSLSSSHGMWFYDDDLDYPPDYIKDAMKLVDPEFINVLDDKEKYRQIQNEYGW